jgi:uracil-DNA glycosylase
MKKLNSKDFENLFEEGWFNLFKPFIESDEMALIMNDLKERGSRGKVVFPYSKNLREKCPGWKSENITFRAFKETPFDKLKVVLLGLSPYFSVENGSPIADGLAFSTKHKKLPPSLKILYDAIETDIYSGLNLNMHKNPSLQFLAEQGVLLLNSALTCEPQMPTIHCKLWEPFMRYFFKEIINKHCQGLHIVFFGEEAQKYRKIVNEARQGDLGFSNYHLLYSENHPAYHARSNTKMETNIFSEINSRLASPIKWDNCEWDDCPF